MAHGRAEELTGRRRYYQQNIGAHQSVMVLEVEVSYFDMDKRQWAVKWRDATPADIPRQELSCG